MIINLVVCSFFICILIPKAYETSGEKCVDDGTCLLVCNYTNNVSQGGSNATGYQPITVYKRVSIYYDFKTAKFMIGSWDGRNGTGHLPSLKGPKEIEKLFSNSGSNVYVQNEPTYKNFICPKNGYYDLNAWIGGNELCFDDDGKWCATERKNAGTTFGTASKSFKSGKRDMTYDEELKKYFDNWSMGDITLDDFINGKYKDSNDITNKIINDIKNNYLHGNDMPEFISNSQVYKNGVSSIIKNFENMKNEWNSELEDKINSGDITEEEAQNIQNNIENIESNLEEDVEETLENLTSPQVQGNISNNEIVDISFCQGGVLRSFQIIGYIIFIIKIVIPLILIILGSIDFAKGIIGGEKANKETISAFVRRIIAAVIVFLIPTVLNFIIGLIDGAEDVADDFSSCGHCLFDPLGDDCDAKAIGE